MNEKYEEEEIMPALKAPLEELIEEEIVHPGSTVQKWGNSLAVRLPKDILKEAGIEQGTRVEFKRLSDGSVVLVPIKKKRKKYTLDELLAQCVLENRSEEVDFGIEGEELI
ncbi:AbrB/MazE/SpoVT family DNA-binding domain-containing protein [Lysinibacillus sp. KU-BSD001]|uniref:AbrB/MazE/SpoVT family DNA-binding domain-containing protein n=1 Tax=Lysinibacillus sp. KU-BSD001 TaxID=3141328 RepID=UPI0036E17173